MDAPAAGRASSTLAGARVIQRWPDAGPVPELSVQYLQSCTRRRKCLSDSQPARGGAGARICTPHLGPSISLLPNFPSYPSPSDSISPAPRVSPPPAEPEPKPPACFRCYKKQDHPVKARPPAPDAYGPALFVGRKGEKSDILSVSLPGFTLCFILSPPLYFVLGPSLSGLLSLTRNS